MSGKVKIARENRHASVFSQAQSDNGRGFSAWPGRRQKAIFFGLVEEAAMRVMQLDHLVLTVKDIGKTVSFYTEVLGMRARAFGNGRTALHFGNQKLNLHPTDRVLDPNVKHATPGSADICFLVDEPVDDWMRHLSRHGIRVILGPVERTGARGQLRSIYIYDPDENLVELSNLVNE
jgi:catechol 2,3-dioxygenase-like lactoylglutathione lyase family enzyme